MEEVEVSTSKYKGLTGYFWRPRRGYQKLSVKRRRRRVWRIAPKLKLKPRIPSPKKFLRRLRDAYVNLMLGFANSRVFATSYGGSVGSFGARPLKEYDDKMIIDIYKSIILSQAQLVPCDPPKPASDILYCQ